jgi:hypothetical protein
MQWSTLLHLSAPTQSPVLQAIYPMANSKSPRYAVGDLMTGRQDYVSDLSLRKL